MVLREHQVKLGPVRTRYFEGGNPLGPTVVLIHEGGYGGDALNTSGPYRAAGGRLLPGAAGDAGFRRYR